VVAKLIPLFGSLDAEKMLAGGIREAFAGGKSERGATT
jgi:hypothetical protein